MEGKIYKQIENGNKKEVIKAMIEPSYDFVGKKYEYNFDFENGISVIHPDEDFAMPVINIESFMDELLEFDEFTDEVNKWLFEIRNEYLEAKTIDIVKRKFDEVNTNGYLTTSGYTYNFDNDLSRDFLYDIFEYDGESYVLISVHYGADARGGFGDTVCFKIRDIDYFYDVQITYYDTETDMDMTYSDFEEVAVYDKETDTWTNKENGNEINLYNVACGF
jgi:hypothetical protein